MLSGFLPASHTKPLGTAKAVSTAIGKALFMRNCGTCHMKDDNEHFLVPAPANTGLRGKDAKADGGVGDVTLRARDLGSFKSPSLRNVEVTAPYGHDGRFATLDALIDHYSDNPISDPNLGYVAQVRPLKFTASEKAALIAFLKTLTDGTCLTDPRFSNPFVDRKDAVKTVKATVLTAGAMLSNRSRTDLDARESSPVRTSRSSGWPFLKSAKAARSFS